MQRKRADRPLLFCFLMSMLAASGCRPATSSLALPPSPHQGNQLTIRCPNDAAARLIEGHAQPWALRQGVTLRTFVFDTSKGHAEGAGEAARAADIWLIPPASLPGAVAAGLLAPVPAAYQAREHGLAWHDLLSIYREHLVPWEGKPYGLPVVGESPVCCYRADLLKAPAHQAALRKLLGRDLDRPITWEQFAQLAEYFRDHRDEGRPAPSLPPWPASDAGLDRLFYTVAAGYARHAVPAAAARQPDQKADLFSFHYDLRTGEPRIAAPSFVHALKLLQRLGKCRPKEPVSEPEEAFRDGRAVLCLTDAPWIKTFQKTRDLHDKVGVCRVPGGECYFDAETGEVKATPDGNWVPYLGGSGLLAVVSRSCSHPEAAFDLLADLAGPKTSAQIFLSATRDGGPTRTDQLYRSRWDTFDLEEKREDQLRNAMQDTLLLRHLKNPALCLRTPRAAAHQRLLVKGLRKALFEGADAEQTLREVAEGWRKLDREQGLAEHQADYRRSLGLLAK